MTILAWLGLGILLVALGLNLLGLDTRTVVIISLVSLLTLYSALKLLIFLSRKSWEIGKKLSTIRASFSKVVYTDSLTTGKPRLTGIAVLRSKVESTISSRSYKQVQLSIRRLASDALFRIYWR